MTPSELFRTSPSRWGYASWIDIKIGFCYIETPKVACTKIKKELQLLCGYSLPLDLNTIHYRPEPKNYVSSLADFEGMIDEVLSSGLLRFCFVRDPLDRAVSAYKDKILRSKGPFWERYRTEIRALHRLSETEEISLEHFLAYVSVLPDSRRDTHWRSQTALLKPDVFKYDVIGRLEMFDRDFSKVLNCLDVSGSVTHLSDRENATSNSIQEVSREAKKMVRNIYAEDYHRFEYS